MSTMSNRKRAWQTAQDEAAARGLTVTVAANSAARIRGSLDALRALRDAVWEAARVNFTIIATETVDGVPTGDAPRIEIHPSIVTGR